MKKLSLLFAAAFAVGMSFVSTARAEVLVYEGFAKSDYNINEAAGGQGTASGFPGDNISAIGTSSSKWEGMGGSQIKVYGSYYGLSLPESLILAGFTATGGSIGTNNGSSNSDLRGMYHALAADVLKVSSGKLFVRMLLSIDSKAAGKLNVKTEPSNASGGYYGFGVMKAPSGNDYSLLCQNKSPSAIGFGIWKDSDGCNLSLMLTDVAGASTNYEVIHGISMDTTYICYAELSIGAGANGAEVVRAGAQTVADYESPVVWADIGGGSDSIEVDVISDTVYPNAMGVVGPYGSNGGFFRGDELRIGTQIDDVLVNAVAGAPQLTVATLSGAKGSYTVSDTVIKASATDAGAIAEDSDGNFVKFSVGSVAENDSLTATIDLSRLSADTTYQLYSFAENDVAATTNKAGIIYNGNLSIAKVKDANEYQREAGEITVSRASADDFALVVPYTISAKVEGKGTEGATWEAPVDVTIPAGETSATLLLKPLVDASISEDIEVVVAAGVGKFNGFSPATIDMTIANAVFPAGYNTWCATTDGLASDPANWSAGHAPLSTENVLFDGNFSSANCEWDADATSTVASWTQNNGYEGSVTLKTVFPGKGDFTVLTVTGAMSIDSGTLTHPQSVSKGDNISDPAAAVADLIANETYRIRIAADTIKVGASGMIDAMGKGYYMNNTGNNTMPLPSHGGIFSATGCQVYDDPKEPIHVGLPFKTGTGNYYVGKGGGAIYLTVAGSVTVDGAICADSSDGSWAANARASGAAGSVYIQAKSVSGTGSITADGLGSNEQNNKGVGGRVAIITELPVDRGTFAAISAKVNTLNNSSKQATTFGGAGTVFFKDSTMTNGKLVIAEKSDRNGVSMDYINRYTFVGTDGDWMFDSVEIAKNSYLVIPVGAALHLPSGLVSITGTATGTAFGGIIYRGGTLDIGPAADQTMSGKWMLFAPSNCVINANLTVSGGAMIGVPECGNLTEEGSVLPEFPSCNVTVNGDLTIASDGLMKAENCGFKKGSKDSAKGLVGYGSHGGRSMAAGTTLALHYVGYDSVFHPCLPGCTYPWTGGQGSGKAGGVLNCTVSGMLTVDGTISVVGSLGGQAVTHNDNAGSGGAIEMTAGAIAGSGIIQADGGYNGGNSNGGGGRIAIYLTNPDATFDAFTGRISASGCYAGDSAASHSSSAGTVYLKAGSESEKAGTVVIKNRKDNQQYYGVFNTNTTEIVSLGYGGDTVADYKHVKVEVRDYGRAAVNTDVRLAQLTVATADAFVDLEGHKLTVNKFNYPDAEGKLTKLESGTYTTSQLEELGIDCVYDSVGGGSVIVSGTGMLLIVR